MYYSGFQSNAFQNNAFQIKAGANGWMGGPIDGYTYKTPYQTQRELEYKRKIAANKLKLKRVEEEIAEAERKRLQDLAELRAKEEAAEFAALEAMLQEAINLLRLERAELIRLIEEEEAILVILMMMHRRRFKGRLTQKGNYNV